jgi:hypothetical protein
MLIGDICLSQKWVYFEQFSVYDLLFIIYGHIYSIYVIQQRLLAALSAGTRKKERYG